MFKLINDYYSQGFYSEEDVKIFVQNNDITSEQYKEITGKEYESEMEQLIGTRKGSFFMGCFGILFIKGVAMTDYEKDMTAMQVKVAEVDARAQSNTKRINEMSEEIKANRQILSTIERLASEINANTQETKSLRKDVNDIGERMNEMEKESISEDAIKWKQFVSYIFTTFVGIVIAVVAQKIGLK